MTNPRRPDDPRLSTADLAAAGERATDRPADRNAGQRPAQSMPQAQPAQPVQPAAARQPAERDEKTCATHDLAGRGRRGSGLDG